MNFSYNPIEIGQVFRLKKSKKNSQLVAYTDMGKVGCAGKIDSLGMLILEERVVADRGQC